MLEINFKLNSTPHNIFEMWDYILWNCLIATQYIYFQQVNIFLNFLHLIHTLNESWKKKKKSLIAVTLVLMAYPEK